MGIHYEGAGLVDAYCTMGSNWMHRSLDLNIVLPLLHGKPLLEDVFLCRVIFER